MNESASALILPGKPFLAGDFLPGSVWYLMCGNESGIMDGLYQRRTVTMVTLVLCLTGWASAQGGKAAGTGELAVAAGAELPEAPQPQPATLPVTTTAFYASAQPSSSYAPLSTADKFHKFLRQTYSPYTFLGVAFDAGFAQMTHDWPAYGMGMEGYGKRYGALLADREAQTFFSSFLFASTLHQDPRYFRMGEDHSVWHRAAYAASRVLITRSDSGASTANSSLWMGTLLARSLTNAYYPRQERGFSDTMSRVSGSLLSTAQTNLTREFLPDMVRIFRRHEPDRMKEWEEKMPTPLTHAMFGDSSTTLSPPAGK
jgi:hypothetical protein